MWNKEGECLYQRRLKEAPVLWTMFQNVLIYADSESKLLWVVVLEQDKKPRVYKILLDLDSEWKRVQSEQLESQSHHLGFINNCLIVVSPVRSPPSRPSGQDKTVNNIEIFDCTEELKNEWQGPESAERDAVKKYISSADEPQIEQLKKDLKDDPVHRFVDAGYSDGAKICECIVIVSGKDAQRLKF